MARTTRNAPSVDALDNLNLDDMFADDGDALFDGLDIDLGGMEDITGGNLEDKKQTAASMAKAKTAAPSAATSTSASAAKAAEKPTASASTKSKSSTKSSSAKSRAKGKLSSSAAAAAAAAASAASPATAATVTTEISERRKTKRKTVAPVFFDDQDDCMSDEPVKKKAKRSTSSKGCSAGAVASSSKKKGGGGSSKKASATTASATASAATMATSATSATLSSSSKKKKSKAGGLSAAARGTLPATGTSGGLATSPVVAASGQFGGRTQNHNRKSGIASITAGTSFPLPKSINRTTSASANRATSTGASSSSSSKHKQSSTSTANKDKEQQHPGLLQGTYCGISPSATLFYPFLPLLPPEPALKNRKIYPLLDKIHSSFLSQLATLSAASASAAASTDKKKNGGAVQETDPVFALMKEAFKEDKSLSSFSSPSPSSLTGGGGTTTTTTTNSSGGSCSNDKSSSAIGVVLTSTTAPLNNTNDYDTASSAGVLTAQQQQQPQHDNATNINHNVRLVETLCRGIEAMRQSISQMEKFKLAQDLLAVCALLKRQHDFLKQNNANMERWCRDNMTLEDYASVYFPESAAATVALAAQAQGLPIKPFLTSAAATSGMLYKPRTTLLDSFVNPMIRVKVMCVGFKEPITVYKEPLIAKLHRPFTAAKLAASAAAAATSKKASSKSSKKRKLPDSSVAGEDSTKPAKSGRLDPAAAAAAATVAAAAAASPLLPLTLATKQQPQQLQQPLTYSSFAFKPAKRRKAVQELLAKTAAALEAKCTFEYHHGRQRLAFLGQERRMHETAEDKSVPCIHTVGMWTWLQDAGYMSNRIDAAEIRSRLQQEEEADGAAALISSQYQAQLVLMAQGRIGKEDESKDRSAQHQKMSMMTSGGVVATRTHATMPAATRLNPESSNNNSHSFLDRLQSLLVHEGNEIDKDDDTMMSDGGDEIEIDNDDDDSSDDDISISSDEDNDDDDEYYDDNDNILTVNLSTLSMDERAFLHARRAGLMMDYDTSTRTGLDSLFVFVAGLSSVSNASTTAANKKPAVRPFQFKSENGTTAASTSPADRKSSKPTSSTDTNNKDDDGDNSRKKSTSSSVAAPADANSDEKKGNVENAMMKDKDKESVSPAPPDKYSQSIPPPAATTTNTSTTVNTDVVMDDANKSDKPVSAAAAAAAGAAGRTGNPDETISTFEPAGAVTTSAILSVDPVYNANDPCGDGGGGMSSNKKKNKSKEKKQDCHLDDIIESMTDDLLQVTELNHRRGVFLQQATLSCLERPDEFLQRKEREAQTIAACQALLRRAKEAAAARAKMQAKNGSSGVNGGGVGSDGTGGDNLALPW